jgi:hypothetical protein
VAATTFNRLLSIALFYCALAMLPVAAADEVDSSEAKRAAAPTEIAGWIAELDDNRYLVRERATQQLLDAGNAALDPLLAAANSERLEPADRAVWILRHHSRSTDSGLAIESLERLVKLRGRPVLVEKAELQLAQRSVAACQEQLTPLGAEVLVQPTQFDITSVVPLLHVRLGEKWKGTTEDLRCVAKLRHQLHYRLDGAPVDDNVVKLFEEKDKLSFLQLYNTKVTPTAVDALKQKHPDAIVYVRGQALLGVQAENHPAGVLVQRVEDGTAAAAAGIVPGDVIASIDGHSLPDFDRLTARIAQHRPGETIDVEIIRGQERKKLAVTLGRWAGQE